MKTKVPLLAFAAVAALGLAAGCADLAYRLNPHAGCDDPSNPAHVCRVAIAVNSCDPGATITATPDVRHVPRGTWVIQWTLAPGYEFANDGIEVTKPGSVFVKRGKTGANGFEWVDNNRDGDGQHKYNVHILKNGAECAKYDPDVYND